MTGTLDSRVSKLEAHREDTREEVHAIAGKVDWLVRNAATKEDLSKSEAASRWIVKILAVASLLGAFGILITALQGVAI